MQDISRQHSWSWQFETILVLAAHSDAKSGPHWILWQKLDGIYLELLNAFDLWRENMTLIRSVIFLSHYVKGSRAAPALLYIQSHCHIAVKMKTSPVMKRHQDVQIWFLGKSSENHLNSLFSGKKTKIKLFNSEKLCNKPRHAYPESLAQDGRISHTVFNPQQ